MKRLIAILIFSFPVLVCSQERKEIFAIGLSEGLGGPHAILSPTLNFSSGPVRIQFSCIPYRRFLSAGIKADLKSSATKKLTWIASLNYWQNSGGYWGEITDASEYRHFSVLSGIKAGLFRSLKLNLEAGLSLMKQYGGMGGIHPGDAPYKPIPYGEVSLSFNVITIHGKNRNNGGQDKQQVK